MVTTKTGSRVLRVKARRSTLAQTFTIRVLIVNQALKIGSLYITLSMLVRRETASEVVLALPMTLIMTIPAIWFLFVGSPPFRILLGTLSNSFLSRFSLLTAVLPRRPRPSSAYYSRCPLFASTAICCGQPVATGHKRQECTEWLDYPVELSQYIPQNPHFYDNCCNQRRKNGPGETTLLGEGPFWVCRCLRSPPYLLVAVPESFIPLDFFLPYAGRAYPWLIAYRACRGQRQSQLAFDCLSLVLIVQHQQSP